MISIIISSYKPNLFSALEINIAESCDLPYEIIKIENPNLMGICEAYNRGAKLTKYNQLLFIHEDIRFDSKNWGSKLIAHAEHPNVGIIGVAGGEYVPSAPSGWYTNANHALINIIQGNGKGTKNLIQTFQEKSRKATAVDGVFISVNKDVFQSHPFDEEIKGYHGYDTEISLRIAKDYQNYVISDILIEHFSPGNPDKNWFDANIKIRKKHGSNFQNFVDQKTEYGSYKKFVDQYFKYYPKKIKYIAEALSFFPLSKLSLINSLKLFIRSIRITNE